MNKDKKKHPLKPRSRSNILWNAWCIASLIGIWPRFIEHRLITTTHLKLNIPRLPSALKGLKVLQFSDLHLQSSLSDAFLDKLTRKVKAWSPDIILFTGDFLCFSSLDNPQRLIRVLSSLEAPYGCYAVLGNHDYQDYVSINDEGDYDIIDRSAPTFGRGLKRLIKKPKINGVHTSRIHDISLHKDLVALLKSTPFRLLHNETIQVPIKGSFLNLSGLGEHVANQCHPETAFKEYNPQYPGIVLTHNPDSLPTLKGYPGDLILCGHTHGGQINIPGLRQRYTLLENPRLKRGLKQVDGRLVYINRGLSSIMPFRWFSPPELSFFTLDVKHD